MSRWRWLPVEYIICKFLRFPTYIPGLALTTRQRGNNLRMNQKGSETLCLSNMSVKSIKYCCRGILPWTVFCERGQFIMSQRSIVCVGAFRPYAVTLTSTLKPVGVSIAFYDKLGFPYSGNMFGVVANPTNSYSSARFDRLYLNIH